MSLTVETGSGVAGADSYAATAFIDAYWLARPHRAEATTWAAASSTNKDGAAREGTAYIDATWGNYFRGKRRGYVQGLQWPRTDAMDEQGYPLPDLPDCLQAAVAELAARALSGPLAPDIDANTRVKSLEQTVGQITKATTYFDAGSPTPKITYGVVELLLAQLLTGTQPSAPNGGWAWT